MDAQEEVRVDEHSFERELNPGVERSAIASAGIEELDERLQVAVHHGPAIREPRNSRENLRRARPLFCSKPGLTDENRATAGRVLRWPRILVWTADLDRAHARMINEHVVVRDDPAPLQRLRKALRLPQLPHERHADE